MINRICILFGSQTGQAKSIAEGIYDNLKGSNENINIFELDQIENSYEIDNISYAIIVSSTTGDGDPPDNASKFFRRIKNYPSNSLQNLKYTVLGLGDTNYSNFNNCGKIIDRTLELIGAKRFYRSAWADDAIGLEMCVEPWLEGLYDIIKVIDNEGPIINFQELKITEISENKVIQKSDWVGELLGDNLADMLGDQNVSVPILPAPFLNVIYDREGPPVDSNEPVTTVMAMPSCNSDVIMADTVQIDKLTKKFAVKSVHKVTLSVAGCSWKWRPGDSLAVLPCNPPMEVDAILTRLAIADVNRNCHVRLDILGNTEKRRAKVPEHLVVAEGKRLSLRSILLWLCDIRQPLSKAGLRIMSEYCFKGSREQRRILELCSKEGQSLYMRCMRETSMPLLDLLNWFPSCKIPVERLLEVLPRLKPRAYSLCDMEKLSFAFSKVDIAPLKPFRMRPLTGVCTTWIESMAQDEIENRQKIPIYLRKNMNGFTVSDDLSSPLILIGPGTGVSPFIGFLQYFESLKKNGHKIGPIWLFFGCRNQDRDFIFQEQMEYFLSQQILAHLCVGFSRDDYTKTTDENRFFCRPANCKYVQDCLIYHAKSLTSLLVDDGARVFVCGDASGMAKDVLETWPQVLVGNHEKLQTKKDAETFITTMRVQKLYLEDVWV